MDSLGRPAQDMSAMFLLLPMQIFWHQPGAGTSQSVSGNLTTKATDFWKVASNGPILSIAFSPSSLSLASESHDMERFIYGIAMMEDVPAGITTSLEVAQLVVVFSPDKAILATGGNGNSNFLLDLEATDDSSSPSRIFEMNGQDVLISLMCIL